MRGAHAPHWGGQRCTQGEEGKRKPWDDARQIALGMLTLRTVDCSTRRTRITLPFSLSEGWKKLATYPPQSMPRERSQESESESESAQRMLAGAVQFAFQSTFRVVCCQPGKSIAGILPHLLLRLQPHAELQGSRADTEMMKPTHRRAHVLCPCSCFCFHLWPILKPSTHTHTDRHAHTLPLSRMCAPGSSNTNYNIDRHLESDCI